MKECDDCEYRGYSRELCIVHAKSCRAGIGQERRTLPASLRLGIATLAGATLGIATAIVGTTAVSLVGGVAAIHAVAFKLGAGAGLAGGGVGLFKGMKKREKPEENRSIKGTR